MVWCSFRTTAKAVSNSSSIVRSVVGNAKFAPDILEQTKPRHTSSSASASSMGLLVTIRSFGLTAASTTDGGVKEVSADEHGRSNSVGCVRGRFRIAVVKVDSEEVVFVFKFMTVVTV